MRDLNIKNAQQMNVAFERCNHVKASDLNVTAPGDSPNTDGIHVTHTQDIEIENCVIGTGTYINIYNIRIITSSI